ncbi:hypothetical protein EVG20_g6117 [Dentipellis fragilis]|uniref:Uncharacterized protein n=1 Tax=Dentipellis fragilis TaxID=205917 RepID=A0A4Y9YQ88_9AGAM|nr:hypothetical protein EVG20_g6117 [Dentipellis fragilis]
MPRITGRVQYRLGIIAIGIVLSLILYVSFDTFILPSTTANPFTRTSLPTTTTPIGSEISNNPTEKPNSRILLVSAFYPLSKSKHTLDDYSAWMRRFLEPVQTDIYFFTTPELEDTIRFLRGDLPITVNTSFASPFEIPPLKGLEARYAEMEAWDRESFRHGPELYAIWSGKPYFLEEGLKNAQAQAVHATYEYAFWTDAGSFRDDHVYTKWPHVERVDEVFSLASSVSDTPKDELIFFPIWAPPPASKRTWTEDQGPIDTEFSEGSFFGGSATAINWYRRLYYSYHDAYLSRDIFVGKDQTLINALFVLFPSRFVSVWLQDNSSPAHLGIPPHAETAHGSCGSTWYYYEWWLADDEARETMADMWMAEKKTWKTWWKWRARCRVAPVMPMETLLKRRFGQSWMPPKASVQISAS